jgi:tetratricopeptide (TPR) repeat protein
MATFLGSAGFAFDPDSLFLQAGKHFESQEYELALADYEKLTGGGYISAPIYYNIGNCYFKKGELGYAILYYLRAKRLDPNDDDITANLAFARQFMPTRLEGVTINPVTEFLGVVTAPFTLEGIAWLSSTLFILFILLLSAIIYFRLGHVGVKIAAYILLVLVLISSGITSYKFRNEYLIKNGVVVAEEARVFSGPTEDSDLEFVGAFGLTVEIKKSVSNYYLVIFENKRKGWIKKDNVETI